MQHQKYQIIILLYKFCVNISRESALPSIHISESCVCQEPAPRQGTRCQSARSLPDVLMRFSFASPPALESGLQPNTWDKPSEPKTETYVCNGCAPQLPATAASLKLVSICRSLLRITSHCGEMQGKVCVSLNLFAFPPAILKAELEFLLGRKPTTQKKPECFCDSFKQLHWQPAAFA